MNIGVMLNLPWILALIVSEQDHAFPIPKVSG